MARRRTPIANERAGGPAPSALLQALKRSGPLTIRELAQNLRITYEAVRQQIAELRRAGWVTGASAAASAAAGASAPAGARLSKPGPASRRYRVSAAAEHLFPKHYDALSAELVHQILESFGGQGVVEVLGRMTEARVRRWAPLLQSLNVQQKLKALCSLYEDKDAYMEVEWQDGAPALIERNCPFLNVALAHPAICSVSINALERLLGCRVVRERRFQAGHGRCVFRVRLDQPRPQSETFTLEP
ncbi:MAG: winged helix-turn-helix transcriptional regulator [Gammaproteobacteria bacterium]|nr:MAG: winged helix-turn-helix transcriptional regulator [Gammaproteobacteria bacterium]